MSIRFRPVNCLLAAALCAGVLAACSSEEPQKPAEPPANSSVTGRAAFQNMYAAARMWAADAEPLEMESSPYEGVSTLGGKAPIWRATFASRALHKQREFMYVSVNLEDGLNRGVRQGRDNDWSGGTGVDEPFTPAFIKTDSDQAFDVAEKNGGKEMRKREKDFQVFYSLHREQAQGAIVVAWNVIYGHSVTTAPFVAHVEAATGRLLYVHKPADIK